MDRTKINMYGENIIEDLDLYTLSDKGKKAFEYFLSDRELPESFFEADIKAEESFSAFLSGDEESLLFKGDDGIGKTQFLKKYFGISDQYNFKLENDILTIFYSVDGNGIYEFRNNIMFFVDELERICIFFIENYLDGNDIVAEDPRSFYNFIKTTKKDVLVKHWLSDKDDLKKITEEIEKLKNSKRLTYFIMKLKYLLLIKKTVKTVILVFDNIYSEEIFNNSVNIVNECFRNFDKMKYKGYRVKSIYAMNDKVYRDINKTFNIVVRREKKISMPNLIETRYQKACKMGEEWMVCKGFEKEDLEKCRKFLDELNSKYNRKYQNMILGLSQYNKTTVLNAYRRIAFNQTWVRKKQYNYAYDVCETNKDALLTNITCIRALACGDDQMYMMQNDFIPNIFYNTEEEDYAIYILLLMKYYLRQKGKEVLKNEEDTFLDKCKSIWGLGIEYTHFEEAISYLVNKEILACYFEQDEFKDTKKSYYITKKGAEIWDMLRNDSVLIELCREDCFRKSDQAYSMESSYKLLNTGRQHEIFFDLLQIIREINSEEEKLYDVVKKKKSCEKYESMFGKKQMAFYLLEGVQKSVMYSISRENNDLKKEIEDTARRINCSRSDLNH